MRELTRPGEALLAAAALTVPLSAASPWWAVATAALSAAAGSRPGAARTAAGAAAVVVAVAVAAVSLVPSWITYGDRFVAVLVGAGVLPWFAGRFRRQYRALARAGWERAEHLERERLLIADQARLRERARIAQDMHDLLGHDLSLVALSAGALKLAPGLPDEHRRAAADIRSRAAAAVDRLGEVIGLLRGDDAVPSAARLEDLVGSAAAAGLPVTLTTEGEPGTLPPVTERALHRVAQEALTNSARHAPGADVTVSVRYTAEEVRVRVANGPPHAGREASPAGTGGGRGLTGLDERVRLAGGTLTYGPDGGGGDDGHRRDRGDGFAVAARLPRVPGPPAPSAPPPPLPLPRPRRSPPVEEHRLGRVAWSAVLVPTAAVLLLNAALRGWDMYLVRASVLPSATYAGVQVGQDREHLAAVLPDRQTPHRPAAPDGTPLPPGTRCEYYAMTANPFADDSGDAYRLCFHAGRLVHKQVLSP